MGNNIKDIESKNRVVIMYCTTQEDFEKIRRPWDTKSISKSSGEWCTIRQQERVPPQKVWPIYMYMCRSTKTCRVTAR